MKCLNITVSDQDSWEALNAVGLLNSVHFNDENKETPQVSREFYSEMKRCDELSSKLGFIYKQIEKAKLEVTHAPQPDDSFRKINEEQQNRPKHTRFNQIESLIEERHQVLDDQVTSSQQVQNNLNSLCEQLHTYRMVRKFLPKEFELSSQAPPAQLQENVLLIPNETRTQKQPSQIGFRYIGGIIDSGKAGILNKMVHRISRGNAITLTGNIEYEYDSKRKPIAPLVDPETDQVLYKSVFLIVYSRSCGSNEAMRLKLFRIIDSFDSPRFEIPESPNEFSRIYSEVAVNLAQAQEILDKTKKGIKNLLKGFLAPSAHLGCSMIEELRMIIVKEKSIYSHVNLMKRKDRMYYGRVWISEKREAEFLKTIETLKTAARPEIKLISHPKAMGLKPPTFFQTNEFTSSFQEIVNTYGTPRYKEVNPGLFTIGTFPLLFGIMFGDVLHGAVLVGLFGYMILWKEEIQKTNGVFKPVLPARYMLFMMGCCATYFGSLYNDAGSFPMAFFSSCYEDGEKNDDCVYGWGLDPAWGVSENHITFTNSLKMKLAVIFGITHMSWGIIQKGSNAVYFKSFVDFFFEFLPQIVFFLGLFGYMLICIFIKWATFWGNGSSAPSIISIFISIQSPWDPNGSKSYSPLYGDSEGALEHAIELSLLSRFLLLSLG